MAGEAGDRMTMYSRNEQAQWSLYHTTYITAYKYNCMQKLVGIVTLTASVVSLLEQRVRTHFYIETTNNYFNKGGWKSINDNGNAEDLYLRPLHPTHNKNSYFGNLLYNSWIYLDIILPVYECACVLCTIYINTYSYNPVVPIVLSSIVCNIKSTNIIGLSCILWWKLVSEVLD